MVKMTIFSPALIITFLGQGKSMQYKLNELPSMLATIKPTKGLYYYCCVHPH